MSQIIRCRKSPADDWRYVTGHGETTTRIWSVNVYADELAYAHLVCLQVENPGWTFEVVDCPAEDLTPEGVQLVIPGAERVQPASQRQGELF